MDILTSPTTGEKTFAVLAGDGGAAGSIDGEKSLAEYQRFIRQGQRLVYAVCAVVLDWCLANSGHRLPIPATLHSRLRKSGKWRPHLHRVQPSTVPGQGVRQNDLVLPGCSRSRSVASAHPHLYPLVYLFAFSSEVADISISVGRSGGLLRFLWDKLNQATQRLIHTIGIRKILAHVWGEQYNTLV